MRRIHAPKTRTQLRYRRHLRVRSKVEGTAERPRLVVFRSLKHIYAQLVDDDRGVTLLGVSDASEGIAADGSRVFAETFDATEIADHPRAGRLFALAVPVDDADASRLEQLRLTGPGIGRATVRPPAALRTAPATPARLTSAAGGVSLQWDAAAHPMVMVRDARSGEVLSFARGGSVTVPATGADLELVASDGVRSRVLDVTR